MVRIYSAGANPWCQYTVVRLKVRIPPCKKVDFICFNESTLKVTKNPFCSNLEALFVLKVFRFLVILENGLIRKLRLIWKFMTPSTRRQIVRIHTLLPNISGSTGNRTIKKRLPTDRSRRYPARMERKKHRC